MSEENKLIVERKKKLQALSELTALYPNDFKRNISVQELVAKYGDKAKEDLEGEVKFDYCYIQTPFKTDCLPNERLIKTNIENKQLIMQNQIDILKNKFSEGLRSRSS